MGNKAKEYRANALAYDARAKKVRDAVGRQRLNDLARVWRELADHVDQLQSNDEAALIPQPALRKAS